MFACFRPWSLVLLATFQSPVGYGSCEQAVGGWINYPTNIASVNLVTGCPKIFPPPTILTPAHNANISKLSTIRATQTATPSPTTTGVPLATPTLVGYRDFWRGYREENLCFFFSVRFVGMSISAEDRNEGGGGGKVEPLVCTGLFNKSSTYGQLKTLKNINASVV